MVGFLYITVSGMVICYSQIRHRREMRQKMAGKPGMTEICQPCVELRIGGDDMDDIYDMDGYGSEHTRTDE